MKMILADHLWHNNMPKKQKKKRKKKFQVPTFGILKEVQKINQSPLQKPKKKFKKRKRPLKQTTLFSAPKRQKRCQKQYTTSFFQTPTIPFNLTAQPKLQQKHQLFYDICRTQLNINHHKSQVQQLQQAFSRGQVILLKGQYGSGKTYCIQEAVKNVGCEMCTIDPFDVTKNESFDTLLRRSMVSSQGRFNSTDEVKKQKLSVVVIDDLQNLSKNNLDDLFRVLSNMYSHQVKKKPRKAKKKKTLPNIVKNVVVLTCDTNYHAQIYKFFKHTFSALEIKCPSLTFDQALSLMFKLVKTTLHYDWNMYRDTIKSIIRACLPNMTQVCCAVQSCLLRNTNVNQFTKEMYIYDPKQVGIFQVADVFFKKQRPLWQEFEKNWNLLGDYQSQGLVFSHYPQVFARVNSRASQLEQLVSCHDISEAFSFQDSVKVHNSVILDMEVREQTNEYLKQKMYYTLHQDLSNKVNRVKVNMNQMHAMSTKTSENNRKILAECYVNWSNQQNFYYLHKMYGIIMNKKATVVLKPNNDNDDEEEKYNMWNYVGKYYSRQSDQRVAVLDIFGSQYDDLEKFRKSKGRKKTTLSSEFNKHFKTRAVSILSRPFKLNIPKKTLPRKKNVF